MADGPLVEQGPLFLPKWLTPETRAELWSEVRSFPAKFNYYSTEVDLQDQLLQGDGWHGFIAIDFESLTRKEVGGLIMSNSCDIDLTNSRTLAPNVLFAPIFTVDKYYEVLRAGSVSEPSISSNLDSIRRQEKSDLFYLPQYGDMPESIAQLGDARSQPVQSFTGSSRRSLFTLSQSGFYLLLIKLAIHFTRTMEGVSR